MRKFGDTTLARVKTSTDLRKLLVDPCFGEEVLVVKPNWYAPYPANFTDAEVLRMFLEAVDSRVVVTEAYTLERQDGSMKLTVDGEEVDWRWILKHPDWGWAKEERVWDEIRMQDGWFLDEYGFTDLFDEFGVEYVNVTEEVWQGRIVDPTEVKRVVEDRFSPAFTEKLYGFLPRKLYDLKGSTLVSLGKVKGIGSTFPSLVLKNLFGLVPDPLRPWWHGPKDSRLGKSIVDIAKVYASFFEVYGVCEAIKEATVSHPEGEVKVPWGRYDAVRDLGVVVLGPCLVSLDAVLCGLIGVDPEKVSYLQRGEEAFGKYDRSVVEEAKAASSEWFPV
ncbi:MAG: DUF362 domain-containing protein [Candidatus Bathyarchaeota archaeon]|nr:DUF362 domain-containing protein [Candidatus Bathyarchaeota archaeon]